MTPRERLLALGVGVTVGLFGLQYGITRIYNGLQAKRDLAEAAEADFEKAKLMEASGFSAGNKLNQLKAKSLPANFETLSAQYRDWLFEIGERAGLADIKVATPKTPSQRTSAYNAYDFTLSGTCRTDQLIELLGDFYDKDYLHTVKSMKLNRTKNPNEVKLDLEARALAMNGVDEKQEPSSEPSGRLAMSIDEYKLAILNRNPFSPPNQAPKISTKSAEIKRGEKWSLDLEATDPENHNIVFEFVSTEVPAGLKLERNRLSWSPEETGEFEVLVRARDNGWPSKLSPEEKLTLRVIDPPVEVAQPKEPAFDIATQAFITMIAGRVNAPQAKVRSRTDGTTIDLVEGTDFELGSIKAKVVSINLKESFVELETDGARWTVGMETSLADAYGKSQID